MFYLILFGIILTLGGLGLAGFFAYCLINGATFLDVWFLFVGSVAGLIVGVVLLLIAAKLKRKRPIYYKKILPALFGNDVAQVIIGYCYYRGEEVNQSYTKAVRWFLKAYKHRNARAAN